MVLVSKGDKMTLGTLGAVIKYALKLESSIKSMYETALNSESDSIESSFIQSKLALCLKNIKRLKRMQRENTTEMILEPIKDFQENSFNEIMELSENIDFSKQGIIEIESRLASFYNIASEKVSFLGEVSYILEQLAEKHSQN